MARGKIASKQYKASLAAARAAGDDKVQSHWESRLKAELKRAPKPASKPVPRQGGVG